MRKISVGDFRVGEEETEINDSIEPRWIYWQHSQGLGGFDIGLIRHLQNEVLYNINTFLYSDVER